MQGQKYVYGVWGDVGKMKVMMNEELTKFVVSIAV